MSGISDKLQTIRVGLAGDVKAIGGGGNNVTNNSTTRNSTYTYAPTFNYNKPLNSKEIYRQGKNAMTLNKILGVET